MNQNTNCGSQKETQNPVPFNAPVPQYSFQTCFIGQWTPMMWYEFGQACKHIPERWEVQRKDNWKKNKEGKWEISYTLWGYKGQDLLSYFRDLVGVHQMHIVWTSGEHSGTFDGETLPDIPVKHEVSKGNYKEVHSYSASVCLKIQIGYRMFREEGTKFVVLAENPSNPIPYTSNKSKGYEDCIQGVFTHALKAALKWYGVGESVYTSEFIPPNGNDSQNPAGYSPSSSSGTQKKEYDNSPGRFPPTRLDENDSWFAKRASEKSHGHIWGCLKKAAPGMTEEQHKLILAQVIARKPEVRKDGTLSIFGNLSNGEVKFASYYLKEKPEECVKKAEEGTFVWWYEKNGKDVTE